MVYPLETVDKIVCLQGAVGTINEGLLQNASEFILDDRINVLSYVKDYLSISFKYKVNNLVYVYLASVTEMTFS